MEARNPEPDIGAVLEKWDAEIKRKTELLDARYEVERELGPDWQTIYCAMFGGAVGALLLDYGVRVLVPKDGWLRPLAFGLAVWLALQIAEFSFALAGRCVRAYWSVSAKWGRFQGARLKADGERALRGDRAAERRVKRRFERLAKAALARETRAAPRPPLWRQWSADFHLPKIGRPRSAPPRASSESNAPRPPRDVWGSLQGGVKGGWQLARGLTDLVAAFGAFVFGALLVKDYSQAGPGSITSNLIIGVALLAGGLWFLRDGARKLRAWWVQG
jgi:hypothetical protein